MNVTNAIILFLAVLLSGGLFFILKWNNNFKLKLLLSFSGAYLFAISIVSLLPEIYVNADSTVGVYILIGFFFQLLLDYFSEGIEHGHVHVHHHANKVSLGMMLSLCIHAFFEGMPISSTHHQHTSDMLVVGIIIHNIPISLALMTLLTQSGISIFKSILWLSLFALMTPIGMICSSYLTHANLIDVGNYYQKIMAIVVGIFLHISTTILFESSENHQFNLKKLGVIVLGILVALITTFA